MHFGEYELSPSLIGLSLLPTSHPKTFQRLPSTCSWVDHLVSRLLIPTIRLVRTRFRFDSATESLNLAGMGNS